MVFLSDPESKIQNEKALAAAESQYLSHDEILSGRGRCSATSVTQTSTSTPVAQQSPTTLSSPSPRTSDLTQSASYPTPKKRKKRKSKKRSQSVILQRDKLDDTPSNDAEKQYEKAEATPKGETREELAPAGRKKGAQHQRGMSAELGRSLDTVLEVAVTEAADLIPVRRVAPRWSVGALASEDIIAPKRRFSSPTHMADNQCRSASSSCHASNSNSYGATTDEDEHSYTSESYLSTDEESGSIEDLTSYRGESARLISSYLYTRN